MSGAKLGALHLTNLVQLQASKVLFLSAESNSSIAEDTEVIAMHSKESTPDE